MKTPYGDKSMIERVFLGKIKTMEDFKRFIRELFLEWKASKNGVYGEIWRKITPKNIDVDNAPLKETRKSRGRGLVARGRNP